MTKPARLIVSIVLFTIACVLITLNSPETALLALGGAVFVALY